ncbi:YIP1 family protein [Planococcus sp. CAU13]|uniref:YIP1 family protein n=1 Tax=Planococcus sp. CAU13 TaxID=1541197 RepID=UPI00052FE3F3|nr:YIP1 family protein [Planococcus sp. CAU13]
MELNPFLSIWTRPKETVRQFIDHNKLGLSVLLTCIAGIGTAITAMQESGWFSDLGPAGLYSSILIAGILSGLLNVGINTLLYTGIGKLYGGHGNMRDMATAMGPMMMPHIFILPVLLIIVFIYGEQFFAAPADFALTNLPLGIFLLVTVLTLFASIWTAIITSKAIGVVHGFSSWRGFGVFMTVVGLVILITLLFFIGLVMFMI